MPPKIIAHRLRTYRKRLGYAQHGAARLIGVTPTQLMEWEKGARMPTCKHLIRLEALYKHLISDMYAELREEAIKEIAENKLKYGEFGTGKPP